MLRDYQSLLDARITEAQQTGARNVMAVSATGSGKTVLQAHRVRELDAPACKIAHRQELLGQLALALNAQQVPHAVIAPTATIREIVKLESDTHGRSFYNSRAMVRVAAVNTITARGKSDERWFKQCQLVVIDEGHHVLAENVWGRAMSLFPGARGEFYTAHAIRADGRGLGRTSDGLADALALGPNARELIARGYLTDYELAAPHTECFPDVPITAAGDYNQKKLCQAVHESKTIVGDVARDYVRLAGGKLGITFTVDIESAKKIALEYHKHNVPAEVITGETPTAHRAMLMRRFRAREILQLVSVDVLGEGVDVPAVEVISMARPTASFQLFAQQVGRLLRVMVDDSHGAQWHTYSDAQRLAAIAASKKPRGLWIDHVGNWQKHGLPDRPRKYTLDRRERASRGKPEDVIDLRNCLICFHPYERSRPICPYCNARPLVMPRSTPDMVDGNISLVDPAILAELRGEIAAIDGPPAQIAHHAGALAQAGLNKTHKLRADAQTLLRQTMMIYGGWQSHMGYDDESATMRFYARYRTDVLTAQTLGAREADELRALIQADLDSAGVTAE